MSDDWIGSINAKVLAPAHQRLASEQMRAAETTIDAICEQIKVFQDTLSADEETWMSVMGAGGGLLIRPSTLTALGIDKIIVDGEDEQSRRIRAIQHVSQVNLVLVAVKTKMPTRIGFGSQIGEASR